MNGPAGLPKYIADAIVVTVICFGWFIVASIGAVASGFPTDQVDDPAFGRLIVFELIFGATAIGYLYYRGHDLAPLVPRPTAMGCLAGLGLYAGVTLAAWPFEMLFHTGSGIAQPIEEMVAQATISLPTLIGFSIVNGIYEETFLIGYLLRALDPLGAPLAIGATVLIRVLYHLYQGPTGTVSILVVGTIFSVFFWRTRKLWPVVFAHIFADVAGFALY
jgi:uncharacterized protein